MAEDHRRNLHRMHRRLLKQRSDAIALAKDAKLKIHASISAVVHMGDMKD